ncbi:MAG TPA: BamA/TamA family outer membrane protein [Polyangiaceae bacterium]|nr:BamA/TamA family outer membrane protein [Polyangiaceae bacterium]
MLFLRHFAALCAGRFFGWRVIFALFFGSFVAACTSVPPGRSAVQSVDFEGNHSLDSDELREKLATAESPRFLGFFSGVVYDYSVFDRFVLDRDLQRIERYYRAKGYYAARARAGRVFFTSPNKVKVEIIVDEGKPTIVRRVDFHGLESLPRPIADAAERGTRAALDVNQRFEESKYEDAEKALRTKLANYGYAYVKVQRAADVDLPKNAVAVGWFVTPGPRARFGQVKIIGLGEIPEAPVRRALALEPGKPYSQSELDSAKRALLDMNVFSSVVIQPDIEPAGENQTSPEVPIEVRVEPAKLRAIHLGGGVQVDSIQTDVHVLGGWENRNFFGGLRSFTFEVRPGVVLYPTRIPTLQAPTNLLPEGRANAQFRQPGFLEARTGLFTRLDGSIAPVILAPDQTTGPILGYRDGRVTAGLDRSLWRLYGSISHTVQVDSAFTYAGRLDPDLHLITISYPEAFLTLDLRDQRMHPHQGAYFSTDWQVAGVGGDARDVRMQSEARGYLPLSRKVTLAARTTVGLLFPSNYGDTLEAAAHGADLSNERAHWVRDIQLMFLRGFFSGGSGSNRGYALREIGPHGIVPQASSSLAKACDPTLTSGTNSCDLPLGGFTLWEASLELRFPLMGPLSAALFTDTSDVSDRQVDFRFDRPHLSVGVGFRYDTPVGPIRLDTGYRVPGLQAPAGAVDEGVPATTFGLPIAISFGIGEAF